MTPGVRGGARLWALCGRKLRMVHPRAAPRDGYTHSRREKNRSDVEPLVKRKVTLENDLLPGFQSSESLRPCHRVQIESVPALPWDVSC